jgi:HAD superfamily hydrolase (TIGR01509 family)
MKYRAAIFDIDGTLLDSVDLHAEAWREVFANHGHAIPLHKIRAQIGKGGDQLLPVFFSKEEIQQFGSEMERERSELFREKMLPNLQPFPSVRPLFERLHSDGFKIALASSAKKEEMERYAEMLGINDLIEAGTSSDDASKSKPHPDIFEAALEKLGGIPAEDVLAIGDTPYDIEAAAKIAMRTLAMLCGGFPEDDLRRAGALAIYIDPADLLERYEDSPFKEGFHR